MQTRVGYYAPLLVLSVPALALFGVALQAPAVWLLAIALAAVLALAYSDAHALLRPLSLERSVYPSAFEHDTVVVDLALDNRGASAACLIEIVDTFGPALHDRHALLDPGPLPGRRRRRLRYRSMCSRSWGVHPLGPMVLHGADALGLFHVRKAAGGEGTFSVFPQVVDVPALADLGARPSLAPEAASRARSGQGALYLGVRDYRPGDDLRRIHWPATARRGSVVVREHELDLVPHFSLLLDLNKQHRAGTGLKSTLEFLVRSAACLLWSAVQRGEMIQLIAEGARPAYVPVGSGPLHLTHCLSELLRLREDGTRALPELVESCHTLLPEHSTLAVLSASVPAEIETLETIVQALVARGIQPLLVFVDADSFLPIARPALAHAAAVRRDHEVAGFLRAGAIPGAILRAEHDLLRELARPDLFRADSGE